MTMPQIAPILASLRRHRMTTALLILQVALTCAIVANVASMTVDRVQGMRPASGLVEDNLLVVESTSTRKAGFLAQTHVDLQSLRELPDVLSATAVDSLPLGNNTWTNGIRSADMSEDEAAHHAVSIYTGFPGAIETLGLKIVAGRDFQASEYLPLLIADGYDGPRRASAVIISQALADSLWPGKQALGQTLYFSDHPLRVVGILQKLLSPTLMSPETNEMTIMLPLLPDDGRLMYVIRVRPGHGDAVLARAQKRLNDVDAERVIEHARTYAELRRDYFRRDTTMIGLLLAAGIGLLFVTGLGIAGLASFWVQQRYRQIGIRRAIGATRAQIRTHFQVENGLIVGAGVILGSAFAVGFNVVLMHFYEVDALPLFYLPVTAAGLWLLGQAAVFSAAFRASHVPPVVAIRAA
jgi:putative ABC transport system permease protein